MLHDTDRCQRVLSENRVKLNAVNPAIGSACLNTRVVGLIIKLVLDTYECV